MLFILAFLGVNALVNDGALEALPVPGLFGYVAVRLQPSLNEIMTALNSLKFVGPGIDLIYRDLLLFPAEAPAATRPAPLSLQREIRFEGVSIRYEGAHHDALIGVDLTIAQASSLASSGRRAEASRRSSTLMLGLLTPTSGRVTVDGVDIRGNEKAWHESLGVVHQTVFLADTSIRRNVALGSPDDEIDDALVAEASGSRSSSSSSRRFPTGSNPSSASAECASQAANASGSRSRGPSIGSRVCSFSTRVPRRSTPSPKGADEGPCAAARPSGRSSR